MAYVYTFLTGILIGICGGILAYRNNASKIKSVEDSLKK